MFSNQVDGSPPITVETDCLAVTMCSSFQGLTLGKVKQHADGYCLPGHEVAYYTLLMNFLAWMSPHIVATDYNPTMN